MRIVVFSRKHNPTSISPSTCHSVDGWSATSRGSLLSVELWMSPRVPTSVTYDPILHPSSRTRGEGYTDAPYYHLGTRGPSRALQARPILLRSGSFPRTRFELGKVKGRYAFSYLDDKIPEDHGEDLVRDIRRRRIFAEILSFPSPKPSINIRHQGEAILILQCRHPTTRCSGSRRDGSSRLR
ncbi:hypothetical protein F511_19547 [Dorcoceras hygrometricum]|uniref:Uncharacterized protein n=1 Tax=Dorcoceras hygrometricum TaxID=472368 RepID=A0A2Z7D5G4_9LAMI|nr:hypothetical protein F511_19547 [Dorcoceras hygrometricum]